MPPVKRHDEIRSSPIGKHGDRGVRAPEWKVTVAFHEVGDCGPVVYCRRFHFKRAEAPKESAFNLSTEAAPNQVCYFSHNEPRHEKVKIRALEYFEAPSVVFVVGINDRIKRAGVNDRDHGPTRHRGSPPGLAQWYDDRCAPEQRMKSPVAHSADRIGPGEPRERVRIPKPAAAVLPVLRLLQGHLAGLSLCASHVHTSITRTAAQVEENSLGGREIWPAPDLCADEETGVPPTPIGRELEGAGIRTKKRRKTWTAQTVAQILARADFNTPYLKAQ